MEWIEEKIGRAATKKYIKDVLSEDKNPQNKDQMLEPDIKSPFLKYGLQHRILRLEDEDDKSSYLVLYITYRLYTNIDVFLYISEYMSRLIKQVFFLCFRNSRNHCFGFHVSRQSHRTCSAALLLRIKNVVCVPSRRDGKINF